MTDADSVLRADLEKRPADVAAMFDHVSSRYDLMNTLMTGGLDKVWSRALRLALAPHPGDVVLVEAPSYVGALGVFRSYQVDVEHVTMDDGGLVPEALAEALQRDYRITVAGPTTLLATLSSFQMGFRTLALEQRSAEVWEVLGAVKTEFAKFGDVLARTKKKLDEASRTINEAETRTRQMTRKLKTVEALPEGRAQQLLPGAVEVDDGEHAAEPDKLF